MSSYSYNGNRTDIFKILADFRVPFSKILDCKPNTAYDWKKTDLKKYAKDLANTEVVYDKNNVVILKTYSRDSFESLCRHTYIKGDKISLGKEGYMLYIVFDFNKEKEDDNSIVAIQAVIDEYKTETLTNLFNLYGLSVDKKEFLPSIKVKEEEFVKQIELDNNVLLHKLIDEEREEDAIKLVKESKDLDVNFAFNERIPVFSAVQKGLYKLCNVIINTEKYDSEVLDDFNEKFLTHIGYQAAFYDESEEEGLNSVFHTIFDCGKFDFTQLNESNENILNIISGVGFLNWFSKELIKRQEMDINNVNDTDETILSNAMADNNKELVEFICTRPDLTIRDIDRETAKEQGYNLDKLVKPNKDFFREERKVSKRVVKSVSSMEEISDEDKECLKKVYSLVFGK